MTVLGNVFIGIGAAGLRLSLMGNDPFTGMNMAISGGLGVGLGTYHLLVNCVLMIIQLIWGRKYIGFGTLVNMCLDGYIIEYYSNNDKKWKRLVKIEDKETTSYEIKDLDVNEKAQAKKEEEQKV